MQNRTASWRATGPPAARGPGATERASADASPADPAHKIRRGDASPAAAMASRSASEQASTEMNRVPAANPAATPPGVTCAQPHSPCARQYAANSMGSNAAPETRSTPDSTRRPIAGNAGVAITASQPNASAAKAISAPALPRSVESIFLKTRSDRDKSAPPSPAYAAPNSPRARPRLSEIG